MLAVLTYQVVMLLIFIRFLKLREVLAKLVLCYKIAVKKQFNGIIDGSPAHIIILSLHVQVKRVSIKVLNQRIDCIKYSKTFPRLSQRICIKIGGEHLPNFSFYFRLAHFNKGKTIIKR